MRLYKDEINIQTFFLIAERKITLIETAISTITMLINQS